MPAAFSRYFNFIKVREQSPDTKDWAVTDANWELLSTILKAFENHTHSGVAALTTPGFSTTLTAAPSAGATTITVASSAGAVAGNVINVAGETRTINTVPGGGVTITLTAGLTNAHSIGDPVTLSCVLTENTSGGFLTPGTTVGVRLAYVDANGLETAATTERDITLTAATARPLTPQLTVTSPNPAPLATALPGGNYLYVLTKVKGTGETDISDALPVSVPFDQTYSVNLTFDAISTYSDGTTALNIYRSSGLNSSFQLVTQITNTSATTFVDVNNISPANADVQPPSSNTFDGTKKVHIDFASLAFPASAVRMNIYVTQQPGVWSTNHLLTSLDLLTTPPTYVDYLGTETLQTGWPAETGEIPASPAKINLGTQTTGGFLLTVDGDFAGFQAKNLVLHSTTSPNTTNGTIYYDTSIPTVRARINGAWVNWGTTAATAYTHPAEEVGGHIAANIKHAASSAVTARTIFDRFLDSSGNPKQTLTPQRSTASASSPTTAATSPVDLAEMSVSITPNFNAQWVEIDFGTTFQGDAALTAYASAVINIDGSAIDETTRSITLTPNGYGSVHLTYHTTLTSGAHTIKVQWYTNVGTITSIATRRQLTAKLVY